MAVVRLRVGRGVVGMRGRVDRRVWGQDLLGVEGMDEGRFGSLLRRVVLFVAPSPLRGHPLLLLLQKAQRTLVRRLATR